MKVTIVTQMDELNKCLEIRRSVFVEEQQVSVDEEIDEYDVSPAACLHVLVEEDGQLVAAGRVKRFDEATAKMQRIAVMKPYRDRGVGKLLMETLEAQAARLGYSFSLLDAQCQAEGFYKKLGYETISPDVFLDAGIPHVRMRKRLG